ncbi:MAG TPA: GFA family protein [Steroidobacteraceae bacterium]
MSEVESIHTGRCLCGGVRYRVRGTLREVITCHCTQCRQTSGHYVAASGAPTNTIELLCSDTLTWYASSATAERGFCRRCGGNLFWRPLANERAWTSIMAGTLDPPTGLSVSQRIYVADKSDYYRLEDDIPHIDHIPHSRA